MAPDKTDEVPAPADAAGALDSMAAADLFAEVLAQKPGPRRDRAKAALDGFLEERDPVEAIGLWIGRTPDNVPRSAAHLANLLARDVAEIDRILSRQLDAILHHPRLQQLEASWRGLFHLVEQAELSRGNDGPPIKVRVLDASWKDMAKDIERAAEFDQSQLFKKVYEAEFGTAGGEPYGLLLCDYEVCHRPLPGRPTNDIAVLDGISHVAAAAFAPFIVGGHPGLLSIDRFDELEQPMDLARTFQQMEYVRWNAFRKSDDTRFIGITMPRVLMRLPYADDGTRTDRFRYREDVADESGRSWLWGTAVYALGGVVIRAFAEYSWPAGIRGVPKNRRGGGIVSGMATSAFETDAGGRIARCPTDVVITDRLEQDLSDLGFIPLTRCRDSADLAFFSVPSVQVPQKYDTAVATANARLSSMLPCILSVSRFAHYLKLMAREKIGSFVTPEKVEQQLDAWLAKYCTQSEDASTELRAERPLSSAKVEVREHPGKPGSYACVVHLKPHFQVEHVVSAVKLVTEFAPQQAQ